MGKVHSSQSKRRVSPAGVAQPGGGAAEKVEPYGMGVIHREGVKLQEYGSGECCRPQGHADSKGTCVH